MSNRTSYVIDRRGRIQVAAAGADRGRAGDAQVGDCHTAFVTGNGGIMSEQVAIILQGD